MSDVRFSCPHCDQHIVCEDGLGGSNITCPSCAAEIAVPQILQSILPSVLQADDQAGAPLANRTASEQSGTEGDKDISERAYNSHHAFRRTATRLGALAVILGAINVALGVLVLARVLVAPDHTPRHAAVLSFSFGVALLAGGLGSIFRQTWSFYIVLIVAYLIILSAVLNLANGAKPAVLAAVIAMSLVWRGHAALTLARQIPPRATTGEVSTM